MVWSSTACTGSTFESSIAIARGCGDERRAAWSLSILGRAHIVRGELEAAQEALEGSLGLVRSTGWIAFAPFPESLRAEVALRESEARYRALFESLDAGLCVVEMLFDDHDQAIDARYIEVNPAFMRQTGLGDPSGKLRSELGRERDEHRGDESEQHCDDERGLREVLVPGVEQVGDERGNCGELTLCEVEDAVALVEDHEPETEQPVRRPLEESVEQGLDDVELAGEVVRQYQVRAHNAR